MEIKKTRISLDFSSPEHAVDFYEMLCEKIPMWNNHSLMVETTPTLNSLSPYNKWVVVNKDLITKDKYWVKKQVWWEYYTDSTYDDDLKPLELGELSVWVED